MQAYCNVATLPQRKVATTSGKVFWEFRAAESFKGDSEATWYTVRVFEEADPQLAKGDFVLVTGKLKNDVFMGREGRPMGILTLLAFSVSKVQRGSKNKAKDKDATQATASAEVAPEASESESACEAGWLALVQ